MSKAKRNYDYLVDLDGNYYNPNIGGSGGGGTGTGPAGPQGPIGPAGAQGIQGPPGQKGAKGTAAPLLDYQGAVATVGALPAAGNTVGDTYFVNDGSGLNYAWNGTSWQSVGQVVKGNKGDKGSDGAQGATGAQGPAGAQGLKGSLGATGATGPQGATGPAGPKGAVGPASTVAGPTGPKGPKGPQGAAGAASAKGDKGPAGPKGPKGTDGATGPAGAAGPASTVAGPTGPAGPAGPQGPAGANGLNGQKGQQGLTGPKGPKGPQGTAAPLLSYEGNVATKGNLTLIDTTGFKGGETYFVDDGNQTYYSYDLNTDTWVTAGQAIKGQKGEQGNKGQAGLDGLDGQDGQQGPTGPQGTLGPKGPVGAQGVQGPTGAQGVKGPIGVKGVKGDDGQAAPLLEYQGNQPDLPTLKGLAGPHTAGDTYFIEDGSQTYYSWDGSQWVSAGQAIKGDVGEKGQKGQKGDEGTDAYNVAVKGGFVGSEAAWLQSLKGDKGQKGDEGQSAYLAAVKGGFVGSEAAWLLSLKGQKGVKGEIGKGQTTIGTVTAVGFDDPTTVTNVGTPEDPILDFNLAKGKKGEKGKGGSKGGMVAGGITAHANFQGGGAVGVLGAADIVSSYGVASVEKTAAGQFTITWAQPFQAEDPVNPGTFIDSDAYTTVASIAYDGIGPATGYNAVVVAQTATTCNVFCERGDNGDQEDVSGGYTFRIMAVGEGDSGYAVLKGQKGEANGPKGDKGEKGKKGQKGIKGLIPAGAATGHVSFDGSTAGSFNPATDVISLYNVSSVVRNGVGDYTIAWDTDFVDSNYTVLATAGGVDHGAYAPSASVIDQQPGNCRILIQRGDNGDQVDESHIAVIAYGDASSGIHSSIKGEKGPQGPATITVGTTTTTAAAPATVTNSGTLQDAVLDFSIPKGEKGDKQFQAAGAVTAHATFVGDGTVANGVLGAGDIKSSFGIQSIEKLQQGEFLITFTNAFTAADNYSCVGSAHGDYGAVLGGSTRVIVFYNFTATTVTCQVEENNGDRGNADRVSVVFYGDSETGEKLDYKGNKGEKGGLGGPKGSTGTIAVGTTTTVASASANVTNSGTAESAVFDFALPKGEVGPQGEKGASGAAVDKGDKGEPGLDGIASNVTLKYAAWDASAGPSYTWGSGEIDSYGISTVNRVSTGRYEIFFSSNFSSANYAMWAYTYTTGDGTMQSVNVIARNAGSCIVETRNFSAVLEDTNEYICVQFMGT